MVRLLSRVSTLPNTFIQALIVEESQAGSSRMHIVAVNVAHLIDDVCAPCKNDGPTLNHNFNGHWQRQTP